MFYPPKVELWHCQTYMFCKQKIDVLNLRDKQRKNRTINSLVPFLTLYILCAVLLKSKHNQVQVERYVNNNTFIPNRSLENDKKFFLMTIWVKLSFLLCNKKPYSSFFILYIYNVSALEAERNFFS